MTSAGDARQARSGGQRILRRQNQPEALRLLLAQRRLYRRGRRWSYLRLFGLGLMAVAAPLTTAFVQSAAPYVGAAAGGFIFLAKTLFAAREQHWARQAASIQEDFDSFVFELPPSGLVSDRPNHEALADVTRGDLEKAAESEGLRDWYVVSPKLSWAAAVAIAQRANAAYSERLLRLHANVCLFVSISWSGTAIALSLINGLSLARFVAGVLLPVLPALLGAYDLYRDASKAANDRELLAASLEDRIRRVAGQSLPNVDDLRRFQDHLYLLRRDGPLVPEFLYFKSRERNNAAMTSAALALSADVLKFERSG